jgi:hypothetical protein
MATCSRAVVIPRRGPDSTSRSLTKRMFSHESQAIQHVRTRRRGVGLGAGEGRGIPACEGGVRRPRALAGRGPLWGGGRDRTGPARSAKFFFESDVYLADGH